MWRISCQGKICSANNIQLRQRRARKVEMKKITILSKGENITHCSWEPVFNIHKYEYKWLACPKHIRAVFISIIIYLYKYAFIYALSNMESKYTDLWYIKQKNNGLSKRFLTHTGYSALLPSKRHNFRPYSWGHNAI